MAFYAVLKALNPLNTIRPVIYDHGFGTENYDSEPLLVGQAMHSVVDVDHNSIRATTEDERPCVTLDPGCFIWMNSPIHTREAMRFRIREWSFRIVSVSSILAVFVEVPEWTERAEGPDLKTWNNSSDTD